MTDKRITLERWREQSPLWADQQTGLPTHLGPFSIRKTRANGHWLLYLGDESIENLHGRDTFAAFRAMVDAYECWFNGLPRRHVYFIGTKAEKCERVKIGFALDPDQRIKEIQTGNPEKLRVLAKVEGGAELEREYHRRFSDQRRHGEWFFINSDILAEIDRLNGSEAA